MVSLDEQKEVQQERKKCSIAKVYEIDPPLALFEQALEALIPLSLYKRRLMDVPLSSKEQSDLSRDSFNACNRSLGHVSFEIVTLRMFAQRIHLECNRRIRLTRAGQLMSVF
jgi:hypothetical protein